MMWRPIAQSIYVLGGGLVALLLVPAASMRLQHEGLGFSPAAAISLVFGIIILWPVLVALAVAEVRR